MLAVQMSAAGNLSKHCVRHLCAAAAVAALCSASGMGAAAEPQDSAQAKSRLAAVRERIAELTARLGGELKERDALSGRLREAELAITAKRKRLDAIRGEQAAAERRRSELRREQARNESALAAERAALAAQVRAAYMIGGRKSSSCC